MVIDMFVTAATGLEALMLWNDTRTAVPVSSLQSGVTGRSERGCGSSDMGMVGMEDD